MSDLSDAADDLDRLEELEPRPGRVGLANRLRSLMDTHTHSMDTHIHSWIEIRNVAVDSGVFCEECGVIRRADR